MLVVQISPLDWILNTSRLLAVTTQAETIGQLLDTKVH
jgi:hypothetical protein